MKQKTLAALLTLVLMFILPATTMAQDALFDKFNDAEGVTTVFISKTMLQMIPNVKAGDREIGQIASKLDQLRVLHCERPSMIPSIKKQAQELFYKNKYEIVMHMSEDGEHMTVYHKKLKDGKSEFALLAEEDGEISIINLKGNITLKNIQEIAEK